MSIIPFDYQPKKLDKVKRYPIEPGLPPRTIRQLSNAGVTSPVRRIEIFESDGKTRWEGDHNCLVGGTVSLDQNSAERRKLDLQLDNKAGLLRPSPEGGFWYDKIIKVFSGIRFSGKAAEIRGIVVGALDTTEASRVQSWAGALGLAQVDVNLTATENTDLSAYDFIIVVENNFGFKMNLMMKWHLEGKHIITIGTALDYMDDFFIDGTRAPSGTHGITDPAVDSPIRGQFPTVNFSTTPASLPDKLMIGTRLLAISTTNSAPTAMMRTSAAGGDWLFVAASANDFSNSGLSALCRAFVRLATDANMDHIWETQIGEFMIDSIGRSNKPNQIKVTCRDYWKKLVNNKTRTSLSFDAGTSVRELVRALAINSGIDPLKIADSIDPNDTLVSQLAYERGADYGTILKAVCDAFNYEIFFDGFGRLIVRKYRDPSLSEVIDTLKTGSDGNLVNHDTTVNDSRIFNHIIVTSAPADGEEVMPYFGEAINEDQTSPTSVNRLGRRILTLEINGLASDQACRDIALSRLKLWALESYEVNFETLLYSWFEVGEIIEIIQPDSLDFEPTRYLMDTISIPLSLGTMGGTAKRVTFVGNSGSPDTIPTEA